MAYNQNKMINKIRLPNPSDLSTKDWFEQAELCLFHAKKSYEKFCKGLDNPEDVSLYFAYPEMMRNKKFEEMLDKEEIEYEDSQCVEIVISY